MPLLGKRWRHIICNTRGSWLPGDPRGFRSRDHRIHSSGDYKRPPPAGEHAGLLRYVQDNQRESITIAAQLRPLVGRAVIENLRQRGHRVGALSVSARHMHLIVELPDTAREMTRIIGWCKWHATAQ